MEPEVCNVCRDIPASFWITPDPKRRIQLPNIEEVEAEAEKGCSFCKLLVSVQKEHNSTVKSEQMPRLSPKMQVWPKIKTPTLTRYFDLVVKCSEESCWLSGHEQLFFGSCQKLLQDGRSSPDSGYSLREVGRTDIGSVDLARDLAKPIEQLQDTEIINRIERVTYSNDAMEYNLELMRTWIEDCERNHNDSELCGVALVAQDFLPTRLLDLKAFKDDIKLVHIRPSEFNGKDQLPSYLALSHCWGPPEKHPKMTTRANLADHMDRIQFLTLPKTFQDAIEINRRLGHRYLWIDSLCIIQDSEEDWAREASLMAKVYSKAYCTLAALSSRDSSQGLNLVRPSYLVDMVIYDNDNKKYRLRIEDYSTRPSWWSTEYNGSFDDSPLRYRAWAFQEKELSTRIIYFGRNQVLWECLAGKGSIEGEWPSQVSHHQLKWTRNCPKQSISNDLLKEWVPLVVDYSQRSLTKETDKLPAFSGIAQTYQRLVPSAKYVAGMWSSHLPEALFWCTKVRDSRRASEYIAPSWSWASVIAPITFYSYFYLWYEPRKLRVQNMWGLPKHNDAYGAFVDAALVLSGAELVELDSEIKVPEEAIKFRTEYESGDRYDGWIKKEEHENQCVLTKNGAVAGIVYIDVMDELLPNTENLMFLVVGSGQEKFVLRVVVRETSRVQEHYFVGLVLRKVYEDDIPTYRRIGLGRWVSESLIEGVEPCTIRLI